MQTGQNSIVPENWLPQLEQVRWSSVLMDLTVLRLQSEPKTTARSTPVVGNRPARSLANCSPVPQAIACFRDLSAFDHVSEQNSCRSSVEDLRATAQKSCGALKKLGTDIQWVESYITDDKVYCVFITRDEQLVREHAKLGGFPANRISEIRAITDPATAFSRKR